MRACLALMLALAAGAAAAMEVRRVDTHLIMEGAIDGSELAKLRALVAAPDARSIDTVVLRDSSGGDHASSQRVAEFIRERGWRTAVSGYCFAGCALMFLGGRQRHFADDRPVLQTQLVFHGGIKAPMLKRFEPLAPSDLIHFFDSDRLPRRARASVFLCPKSKESALRCSPIPRTDVYREGIVTTSELVRPADRRGD